MCRFMRCLVLIGVCIVCVRSEDCFAYDPPEGVYSFVVSFAGGRVMVFSSWHEGYDTSANDNLFYVGGGNWWADLEVGGFSFAVGEGDCPIRSTVWADHGISISDVKDQSGNTWVDPTTGHPWGWVMEVQGGSVITPVMFGVDWGMSVGMLIQAYWPWMAMAVGIMLGMRLLEGSKTQVNVSMSGYTESEERAFKSGRRDGRSSRGMMGGRWSQYTFDAYASGYGEGYKQRGENGKCRRYR